MRFRLLTASILLSLGITSRMPATAQAKPAAPPPVAVPKQSSAPVDAAGSEYFEKKVRPVLVQYCYECHSHTTKSSMGSLYLDSRGAMLHGGQGGAELVPGEPEKSRLIEAVLYAKPDLQMPPKKRLPDTVISDLKEWVKMGAPWPEVRTASLAGTGQALSIIEKKKREHWAWQPVRKPAPPAVKRKTWPQNPIDQFLLAKLEATGLTPAPPAERRTLIRRAYFDLIGLPPTPEEVDAFLADKSPNAWPKLIDRLLTSPHYGERWGRFWLDIARYGEDQAHSFEPRLYPQGFRYRDWLARALNTDMSYDRFVREQIAADLLNEPDRQAQLPALGFFALGPVYYGDSKMYDQYDDRIDTLTRGFLGLTVACARCHDHKFDPITQKDYYALAGVFANTNYIEVPLNTPNASAADPKSGPMANRAEIIQAKQKEVDKFTEEHVKRLRDGLTPQIARYMVAAWKLQNRRKADPKVTAEQVAAAEGVDSLVLERWFKYLTADKNRPLLAAWRQRLQTEDAKTNLSSTKSAIEEVRGIADAFQGEVLAMLQRKKDAKPGGLQGEKEKVESALLEEITGNDGVLTLPKDQLDRLLVGDDKVHYGTIKAELERLKMGSFVHALTDAPKIADIHVLLRGNVDKPGEEAPRRFLTVLAGDNSPAFTHGSGRLELANAIADKNNPLTARVLVNRVWQHHFGMGLVRTASNFGMLGEPPSNPQLLDYLAARFVEQGWSLKTLHRQIMLSAAYQMSSASNRHNEEVDPDNRLVWRMTPRRLDVEAWRDSMLAVSDKLDRTIGGPSLSLASPDNYRRTYYAAVSRHDLDSMLRLFDFPDPNVTSDARMTTTVPLQQLFVLNSAFMIRQAKAFAARLTSNPSETDAARIRHAFLLAYNRPPSEKELALGLAFVQGPRPEPAALSDPKATALRPIGDKANKLSRWEQYAQVLLSANEFMYID